MIRIDTGLIYLELHLVFDQMSPPCSPISLQFNYSHMVNVRILAFLYIESTFQFSVRIEIQISK